jgi:hypothetical protein
MLHMAALQEKKQQFPDSQPNREATNHHKSMPHITPAMQPTSSPQKTGLPQAHSFSLLPASKHLLTTQQRKRAHVNCRGSCSRGCSQTWQLQQSCPQPGSHCWPLLGCLIACRLAPLGGCLRLAICTCWPPPARQALHHPVRLGRAHSANFLEPPRCLRGVPPAPPGRQLALARIGRHRKQACLLLHGQPSLGLALDIHVPTHRANLCCMAAGCSHHRGSRRPLHLEQPGDLAACHSRASMQLHAHTFTAGCAREGVCEAPADVATVTMRRSERKSSCSSQHAHGLPVSK